MKNKFLKSVSALLIMAFIISIMSVLAVASDEETDEETKIETVYNRDFDDGWELTNGGAVTGGDYHTAQLGQEPTATGSNRFLELITAVQRDYLYYQISVQSPGVTESVLEFDVRSDGMSATSNVTILQSRVNGSTSGAGLITRLTDGSLRFDFNDAKIAILSDFSEWVHITIGFVADYERGMLTVTLDAEGPTVPEDFKPISSTRYYNNPTSLDPQYFRFQCAYTGVKTIGDHIAFDNISYVTGTSEPVEIAEGDYGRLVDDDLVKTVLLEGATVESGKPIGQHIAEAYLMKTGVNRALIKGERKNIFEGDHAGEYGAPVVIDGITYVPIIPLLEHMGYNYSVAGNSSIDVAIAAKDPVTGAVTTGVTTFYMGRDEARVAGEQVKLTGAPGVIKTGLYTTDEDGNEVEISYTVVAMNDIEKLFPGWYITYDTMGFIMLGGAPDLMNREKNLEQMTALIKQFVPDNPTTDQIYEDLKEATNNFDHPYIYADQDELDFISSVYRREYLNEDGTPNEEFIENSGMTLEQLELYADVIDQYVNWGAQAYIRYLVPRDHETIRNSSGGIPSEATGKLFDSDGNFVYPYTQDMKGAGKVVFATNYTSKKNATNEAKFDHIYYEGDFDAQAMAEYKEKLAKGEQCLPDSHYVIVEDNAYYKAKRDWIYDDAIKSYKYVGEGKGIFDMVYDDYVILKVPVKDYTYDEATQTYTQVEAGTGTHDYVGEYEGKAIYAVLRTPLRNYKRTSVEYNLIYDTNGKIAEYTYLQFKSSNVEHVYNIVMPMNHYSTYGTDASDPDTYLEFLSSVCYLCEEDHFGYDPLGQRYQMPGGTDPVYLAIAYQITGEISFARLAYDLLDIIGGLEHWGTAHALNYAGAASSYAITLDLIYDAVVEMAENGETNYKGEPINVKILEQHLFDKGIGEDYVMSILEKSTAYQRDNVDVEGWARSMWSIYYDNTNNWGNVCNGNLALAGMCLLSFGDEMYPANYDNKYNFSKIYPDVPTGVTYRELILKVLENKFWCLAYYAAEAYQWNGAYTESPSYWAYGTNQLMIMMTSLYNITGQHYGILDMPGYDKTFIYASYMEAQLGATGKEDYDFITFAYNDCAENSKVDTGYFFTAALQLDQPQLIAIRLEQLKANKDVSYSDLFLFRRAMLALGDADSTRELEYCEPTCSLFVTRSDWEPGGLYAGMIGGAGITNHAHSDAGTWVYFNEGITWIKDMGSESYNVRSDTDYPSSNEAADWDATNKVVKLHNRFRYYKLSTEGHNTLIITGRPDTLPYGHRVAYAANADMIEIGEGTGEYSFSNEYGSYMMLDMNDFYIGGNGTAYTSSAKRGMLLTNGRKTLVIQDEVQFNNMEYFAWSAHVNVDGRSYVGVRSGDSAIVVSEDGKTVYIYGVNDKVCRMSIVMPYDDARYTFQVRKTDPTLAELEAGSKEYLLESTFASDSHLELGGDKQDNRKTWRNIVITPNRDGIATTDRSVELAVVMEVFDNLTEAESAPISYQYTRMENWEPYEEGRYSNVSSDGDEAELRDIPTTEDFSKVINPSASKIRSAFELGDKLYQISNIYSMLTNSAYSIKGLGGANSFTGKNRDNAEYLNEIIALYEKYCAKLNARLDVASGIVEKLT